MVNTLFFPMAILKILIYLRPLAPVYWRTAQKRDPIGSFGADDALSVFPLYVVISRHFGSQNTQEIGAHTSTLSVALLWFTHVWWQAVGTEGPPAPPYRSIAFLGTQKGSSAG